MYYFLSVLLYLALHITPILAADAPEETLHVTPAPEFQIDLVSAIRPVIEDNYIVIQGFIAIYLFFEFFIFPWLDNLEEQNRIERYKKSYAERQEIRRQYWQDRKEKEQRERELEQEAIELTTADNWDYFSEYEW